MHRFNYNELLKSFEWKQKRQEIIERDKCCQKCGKPFDLNVHHVFYIPKTHPAGYTNDVYIVLCKDCHKQEHDFQNLIESALKYIRLRGLLSVEIWDKFFNNIEDDEFFEFHKIMMEYKKR